MTVRIYVAGHIGVEVDGEVLVKEGQLRGKQGRLAFAYLVTHRVRPVPREELAEVVWPGEMAPAWEGALSALMSRIRGLLSREPLKTLGVSLSSSFWPIPAPAAG